MDSAFTNKVADLCMRMGIALTTWQNVEGSNIIKRYLLRSIEFESANA
jgi:hypothetical protein